MLQKVIQKCCVYTTVLWFVLQTSEVYIVAVFNTLLSHCCWCLWCCCDVCEWSMLVCTGVVFHSAVLWNGDLSDTRPSSDCYGNSRGSRSVSPAPHLQWAYEYESGSDSDADRPDPDLVLDDLASRRFHSPSPAPPTNFAVPISPLAEGRAAGGQRGPWPKVNMTPNVAPQQNVTCLRSENMKQQCDFDVPAWWERKLDRFSYPQFAWLIVTMSNISGRSVLPLTVLRGLAFATICWFLFELFWILAAARLNLPLLILMSLEEWFELVTWLLKSIFASFKVWFWACIGLLILASSPLRAVVFKGHAPFCVTGVLYLLKNAFDTCDWLSLLSSSGINSGEMQPTQQGSVRVDHRQAVSTDSLFREIYQDSEEEDDEVGYADPIQDDLYARKMGVKPQPAGNESYNKFLPKFWTPEEDVHIQKIKMGSQRRPWYKRMQGFRCVRALKSRWNNYVLQSSNQIFNLFPASCTIFPHFSTCHSWFSYPWILCMPVYPFRS